MSMKQAKRRLLSVVMALAIRCTLVPAALAYSSNYYSQSVSVASGGSTNVIAQFPNRVPMGGFVMVFHSVAGWRSSNPSIKVSPDPANPTMATISADPGTLAGTTAVVTATAGYYDAYKGYASQSLDYTFNVTVTGGTGGSTSGYFTTISPSTLALSVGGSGNISVSPLTSEYGIQSVSWNSSNPSVAVVSGNGSSAAVTGMANGTATIQAAVTIWEPYSRYQYTDYLSCTVYVGSASGILSLSSSSLNVAPGGTSQLTAYLSGGLGSSTYISWSSSNPSVVSLDNTITYSGSPVTLRGGVSGQSTVTATVYVNGVS